jgi:hypothetical protein
MTYISKTTKIIIGFYSIYKMPNIEINNYFQVIQQFNRKKIKKEIYKKI